MDSTTRGAVSPRAGSPARTTGSVAPGWALYRGSYASRFTHSSCVARRQRALVVSESRRRDASEGGRRGRDASRRDAPCRRRWRRRATRGSRARVRTCSAPARRDLDAGRGHGVGGSARGERPTSRVHVVETLSELYRARARALALSLLARGDCVSTGVAHLPSSSVASRRCPVRQLPRGVVEPRKTGATHRLAIALDQSPALRLRDERARRLGDRLARPVGGDHARNPIRLRLSTQLRVVLELRVGRFGRARGFRFGQFGLL